MSNLWKKSLAAALVASMLLTATACGKSGDDSAAKGGTGDTSKSDKPTTLTIWNTEVLSPGVQSTEVAKALEEKTNVIMDIVQGDSQKFSILVAGGDLPDIIYTNPAQQGVSSNALISGGHLIALDEMVEKYGENIKKNFPSRLDYTKQFASNGEDKIYFLPNLAYQGNTEKPDVSYSIQNVGLMTRFDVYAAIGYPETKTTDQYLSVLKQMQDYAREKDLAQGKQIYAITGWSDWGLWPWWLANVREMGYDDLSNGTIMNRETNEVDQVYNSDAFWESLKFYNKAYNMGILDPEAFTMKNDQFWEKCNNGQALMAYASWQTESINATFVSSGHPDWSFQKIPFDGYKYVSGVVSQDAPLGMGLEYANAITKNCKEPEKAFKFLDYLNSEEGARLVFSGIEGKHWETKDGIVKPTDEYLEKTKSDKNYKSNVGTGLYNKLCGLKDIQLLADQYPADLSKSDEIKASNLKDGDKAYCDYYSEKLGGDYKYPGQVLNDLWNKGEIKSINEYLLYPTLVQQPSDETLNIIAQCDQYMNVQGVKAIMAKDDAEFEKCKEEAMTSINNKKYDKATEEIKKLYADAKNQAGNFEIKK